MYNRIDALMSLELFNEATTLTRRYSREFWEKALELAQAYGWKPLGTRPPAAHNFRLLNADWPGTYLTNDGQTVMWEDALALARALEKAMDDIPDANAEIDWNPRFWLVDDLPEWLSPTERLIIEEGLQEYSHDVMDVHPFEFFAGDEKQHLRGFIRFCRLGSFAIL